MALGHPHAFLVAEGSRRWLLRCLDVSTGQPNPDWTEPKIIGGAVALSTSGRRIAMAGRNATVVGGCGPGDRSRSLALEHAVKRCAMTWVADDMLAVRTDCGCASIYAVS